MPPVGFGEGEAPSPLLNGHLPESPQNNSTPLTPLSTPSYGSPGSFGSTSPQNSEMFRLLANNIDLPHAENLDGFPANNLAGFQRIAFPQEQSLLDLLRQGSGTHSVRDLRSVRLRVVASAVSLSRLNSCTPRLQILRLDGSGLTSLREIGTGLRHLRVLHVARCGLTSLDGTFGLTTLQELYAADNSIENLTPCAALENIKVLNFDRNPIDNLSRNVGLLSFCPRLVKLSLVGTPVSQRNNYKEAVTYHLPDLKVLDGVPINADSQSIVMMDIEESVHHTEVKSDSESASCSIEVSSMTEPTSDEDDITDLPISRRQSCEVNSPITSASSPKYFFKNPPTVAGGSTSQRRPATASGIMRQRQPFTRLSTPIKRPKTAHSNTNFPTNDDLPIFTDCLSEPTPSDLTSGGVVCGSIGLALSRLRRSSSLAQSAGTSTVRTVRGKRPDRWLLAPPSDRDDQGEDVEPEEDEMILRDDIQIEERRNLRDHSRLVNIQRILSQPLPEKPVESIPFIDLELGVMASISANEPSTSQSEGAEDALYASKMWRKAFRLYRKKINRNIEENKDNVQDE